MEQVKCFFNKSLAVHIGYEYVSINTCLYTVTVGPFICSSMSCSLSLLYCNKQRTRRKCINITAQCWQQDNEKGPDLIKQRDSRKHYPHTPYMLSKATYINTQLHNLLQVQHSSTWQNDDLQRHKAPEHIVLYWEKKPRVITRFSVLIIIMMINHPWQLTLVAMTTVWVSYITWPLRRWRCKGEVVMWQNVSSAWIQSFTTF